MAFNHQSESREQALTRLAESGRGLLDWIYEADVAIPSIQDYLCSGSDSVIVQLTAGQDNKLFYQVSIHYFQTGQNPQEFGVGLTLEEAWRDLWYWKDAVMQGKIRHMKNGDLR